MEFSTLNGYKVKDKKAIRYYDNVQSMKSDNTLKEGMYVKTSGYYQSNDGGHGEYVIIDDTLVDDGGTVHALTNGLYAKLIIENSVNVKQFGAYGDGENDDTTTIQNAINFSYGKELFFPIGNYLITDTLTINRGITINGCGNNGVSSYLGGFNTCIQYDGNSYAFDCTALAHTFKELVIKNIGIESVNKTGNGILIHDFNHFTIDNVTVSEFRSGKGIQCGNNNAFGSQYGLITNSRIGMCLIGIELNKTNGINIENSYVDGNNNGSDISEYEHGYPENSIGINITGTNDSNRVLNTRIQGFEIGIKVESNFTVISGARCEMCYIGYQIDGDNNIIEDGCSNTNYLILQKNGQALTGRYGYVCVVNGNYNIIKNLNYGSVEGPKDNGLLNEIGQNIILYLGDISETRRIQIQLNKYLQRKHATIKSLKFKADNLSDVKTSGYSNRWTISTQSAYIETYTIDDQLLDTFVPIATDKLDSLTSIPCNFVSNGTPVTLKNVIVDLYVLPY